MKRNGFTMTELLIIMAIMGILMSMAGLAYNEWRKKYDLEGQMRTMYADFLSARTQAMQRNRAYFIEIQAGAYTMYEDRDDSGGIAPNAADDPALWTKPLRFKLLLPSPPLIVFMNSRGLIGEENTVLFNTDGVSGPLDCFAIATTRIRMGKYDENKNPKCTAR